LTQRLANGGWMIERAMGSAGDAYEL
jgi:hypothetical protein